MEKETTNTTNTTEATAKPAAAPAPTPVKDEPHWGWGVLKTAAAVGVGFAGGWFAAGYFNDAA
jgi:hypothetical protein